MLCKNINRGSKLILYDPPLITFGSHNIHTSLARGQKDMIQG